MARNVVETLTDESTAQPSVTCAFGLGEGQREIDLSAEHREELEDFLAQFIDRARVVRTVRAVRRRRVTRRHRPRAIETRRMTFGDGLWTWA